MRINKYLSECGYCSRREADRLIDEAVVFINGKPAQKGDSVNETDKVWVKGQLVTRPKRHIYLAFYKPKGIVCTLAENEKGNLKTYLNFPSHITYAGRLDKDSEGLLILTDDGDLIEEVMTGHRNHEKEYVVSTAEEISDEIIKMLTGGVYLHDLKRKTDKCQAFITGENEFHIILRQGLNRQIRRMCDECKIKVKKLRRIRIDNIRLGNLKPGEYRELSEKEVSELLGKKDNG